jgi:hypothetical protein
MIKTDVVLVTSRNYWEQDLALHRLRARELKNWILHIPSVTPMNKNACIERRDVLLPLGLLVNFKVCYLQDRNIKIILAKWLEC